MLTMIFRHVYNDIQTCLQNIFRHVYKYIQTCLQNIFRQVYKIYSDMFTMAFKHLHNDFQICSQGYTYILTKIFRHVYTDFMHVVTCRKVYTRHIYNYIQKLFQWHSCVVQWYSDMYLSILRHFEPPFYKWPDHSLYLEISKLFVLVVILTNIQNSNFELTIARLLINYNNYQYMILFDLHTFQFKKYWYRNSLAVIHAVKIVTIFTISKYFL